MRSSQSHREKNGKRNGVNRIGILLLLCLLLLLMIVFRDQIYSFVEQLSPMSGGLVGNAVH